MPAPPPANREEANGLLWELESKLAGENRLALLSALLFTALDVKDRAFEQLERAYRVPGARPAVPQGRSLGRAPAVGPAVRRAGGEAGPRLTSGTPCSRAAWSRPTVVPARFDRHQPFEPLSQNRERTLTRSLRSRVTCVRPAGRPRGLRSPSAPAARQAGRQRAGRPGRRRRRRAMRRQPLIALIRAADWMGSEWGEDAIKVGLRESDMEAGRDYELKVSSAQGDLATLPSLIDAADRRQGQGHRHPAGRDARRPRCSAPSRVPIVFNLLSDPVRGRRRHQRHQPPPQHHRRLLARLRRSGADPAGGADPADRAQGARDRRALQPGGAAVGRSSRTG